ncbi:hypothetical protein SEA_VORVOLAKOS_51 [Streptomyces phage Vorvolakos]|uniref:Uncharacterized protein n=3 Tax=Flowerpowervirus flowerpower TaxID=2846396 RepID=A0A2U8UNB8_9CAUD|nr:hypothetical protein HWB61_gp50 [Streptomyces phage FlowerPower]QEA11253.1 hypothetical protein SEA_GEOSTIN_46 [Streptomyces phage Geostin]QFP94749.1 hypothetical protein SEA_FABIAN_48 [Streptomyces phage Fabian]QZD97097.1 hypothetical protein SEA_RETRIEVERFEVER_51 [Streptomyces phage RetrieverFever]UOW93264.1 hypothetical protein SEA_VORVOLAKOS_51 [Streptomyces phage Vorvolakos]AWN05132.1 hypothetical protein SEA_FLOWERPOWER_51 [Streptomyces phage FlowerPower]
MAKVQRCKFCKAEKGRAHKFSCQVSSYPSYYDNDTSYVYVTTYVDSSSCSSSSDSGSSFSDSGSSGGCD